MKRQLIAAGIGSTLLLGGVALASTDNFKTGDLKNTEKWCTHRVLVRGEKLNKVDLDRLRDCDRDHHTPTPTPTPSPSVAPTPIVVPGNTNVTVTVPGGSTSGSSTKLPDVGGHGTSRP